MNPTHAFSQSKPNCAVLPSSPRWTSLVLRIFACLLLVSISACKPKAAPAPAATVTAAAVTETEVTVYAAASLREAFGKLAQGFKASHTGTEVKFNFAGSQELRTQIEQGGVADVFASADQKHPTELAKAGQADAPSVFALNEPVVVVSNSSSSSIRAFADLPKAQRLVIGTPEVPIGRYTTQIFEKANSVLAPDFSTKVMAKVVSRELNVRQVLAKVNLGEADAGLVYRTDAKSGAGDKVTIVPIPENINVVAKYAITLVKNAKHPKLALAFRDYVLSESGQHILTEAGFLPAAGADAGSQ